MPAWSAGNTCTVSISRLMTGGALQGSDAVPVRPANDVEKVAVTVVSLLRIGRCSVAVDATRAGHHRVELLPGSQARRTIHVRFYGVLALAWSAGYAQPYS